MNARPLHVDSLWRALCPGYSSRLLHQSTRCPHSALPPASSRRLSSAANSHATPDPDSRPSIEIKPEKKVWGKLRRRPDASGLIPEHNGHPKALYVPGLGSWPHEQERQGASQTERDDMHEVGQVHSVDGEPPSRAVPTKTWGQLKPRRRLNQDVTHEANDPERAIPTSKPALQESTHKDMENQKEKVLGGLSLDHSNDPRHQDRFGRARRRVESLLNGDEADALRIPKHLRTSLQSTMVAKLNRDRIAQRKTEMEVELGRYVTWDEARASISRPAEDAQDTIKSQTIPAFSTPGSDPAAQKQQPSSQRQPTRSLRPPRLRGTTPWLSKYTPSMMSGQVSPEAVANVDQGKLLQTEGLEEQAGSRHEGEELLSISTSESRLSLPAEDESFVSRATKAELYDRLPQAAAQGKMELVECIVFKLVHDLHEGPSNTLYASLILANVSHISGSAARARALVEELKADGLEPDAPSYNALLQVLAVHPDAIYRSQILAGMRDQWMDLTPAAQHYIAAGHIKELQLEQALEVLDAMLAKSIEPEPWLFDMFIYQLCALGEIDEAFRLLRQRVNSGTASRNAISPTVWLTLFDCAASNLHHPALAYIWRRRVELLKFTPSTGQCTAVLHCAARHADVLLATDVFRALSMRGTTFGKEHYELLVDCYTRASDVDTALHILCIMQTAGVAPNERSTRPLSRTLLAAPSAIPAAFETLKELRDQGRAIPIAAVNCIIEVTLDAAEAMANTPVDELAANDTANAQPQFGLAAAIEQYKHVHHLCPSGPNVATFDALLRGCRIERRKDTAMFLAAEMVALGLRPGALTYDRLMLVCLQSAEGLAAADGTEDEFGLGVGLRDVDVGTGSGLEDAKRYYGEMRGLGMWPRRGTFRQMVERCAKEGDQMAWWLLDEMKAGGYDEKPSREWLHEHWRG